MPSRRIEALSVSTWMPFTDPEDQDTKVRPDWPLTLFVIVACLAMVASGWGVARLTLGNGSPGTLEETTPQARPPRERSGDVEPADAEAFLEFAVQKLRRAPVLHVSYTQWSTNQETGHGWARGGDDLDAEFEHYFSTSTDVEVYRYELVGTGYLMTARNGSGGMRLLTSPTAADRRLCSAEFVVAPLDDLAETADDLELVGTEKLELSESPMGVPASTHTAHRYTGTSSVMMGGYDSTSGGNTLTRLPEVEFDLWIDEAGHPRRLDYRTPDGTGETYDYHAIPD